METIIIMILGIAAGRVFPEKYGGVNEKLQLCCTLLLIFSMGVGLGQREGFFSEIAFLGAQSFLFFLVPTLFSIAAVYLLTRRLLSEPVNPGIQESARPDAETEEKQDPMVFMALAALILGIGSGALPAAARFLAPLAAHSQQLLALLMFSVGISVGLHRGVLEKIRRYHVKILVIPAGIIAGSLAGSVLCSFLMDYPVRQAVSIASGLGWYSLAGVTIGNLAGARLGSVAFLSNLMREIGAFFLIPYLSRHLNFYACIASAAATSEDTTLPMMIRYTNEETVVLSVLNGMICSFCVPVLIALCY